MVHADDENLHAVLGAKAMASPLANDAQPINRNEF